MAMVVVFSFHFQFWLDWLNQDEDETSEAVDGVGSVTTVIEEMEFWVAGDTV